MCSEPVAGAFDLDDDGVIQQAVEQGGDHDRIAEHFGPFGEGSIGGQDYGGFLVACADKLEEQVGAFFGVSTDEKSPLRSCPVISRDYRSTPPFFVAGGRPRGFRPRDDATCLGGGSMRSRCARKR